MGIAGKIFARVCLVRLQKLAARVYSESQFWFRSERSTIDMVFSLRQLQEKCREQNITLYTASIDLGKAFDLVSHDGVLRVLEKIGCPSILLAITNAFHVDMKVVFQVDGASSTAFDIRSGVKQYCVLAPTLFGIFFGAIIKHAFQNVNEDILLHTRSSGKLFNTAPLKAKKEVCGLIVRELLFADDAAVAAHSEEEL